MVAWVKITILDDNTPAEGLLSEWGFSAYVETPKFRILFDADTDPRVIEYNANALNVDLTKLDYAVLSHHHGDHYGGFEYIGRKMTVSIPSDSIAPLPVSRVSCIVTIGSSEPATL